MTIEDVLAENEKQIFDRKSIQIKPADLSDTICAFANADGGTIAIGISDTHRRIEGIDHHEEQLNEILRTPVDFCNPTVPVTLEKVECINYEGKPDHVLLMHIEASPLLHANQADEAFIRVGDKTKKLDFADRMTLMYAKGVRYYEDEPVADATIEDLDLEFVRSYCNRIGYTKSPEQYVRENKKFVTKKDGRDQVSVAAILLFGKNPQLFFPRAFIRFIRYDGIEAKVGKEMNVIKDVIFEGRILEQVEKAVDFIKIQMKEKTYLGNEGVFVTEEEYGEFVRTEIVVNAAVHRDYAIKGTDIQIKMFDDRLEVDSPGTFAGMVKKENIRYTHFSRNPKIAAFLKDYGYVKEYGEGVDRMCKELEAIGLPDPVFNNNTFILKTTVRSSSVERKSTDYASIQMENASIEQNDASIQPESASIQMDYASIGQNYASIQRKNASIERNDASIRKKDALFDNLKVMEADGSITPGEAKDADAIIHDIDIMQVITTKEVMRILACQTTKARSILKMMRKQGLIKDIPGKGKGRYILDVTE
jgi:ATP-dependent DNA helicase RecG